VSARIPFPNLERLCLPLLRDDDPRAKKCIPMAHSLAKHFFHRSQMARFYDQDDIFGFAQEGLVEALDTFEADRGMEFESWAYGRIRNHLLGINETCKRRALHMRFFSISAAGEDDEPWDIEGVSRWPDELADIAICAEDLRRLLPKLPPREVEVLRLRHWEDQTLEEIGERFDLTRERVRQLYEKAIESLKTLRHRDRFARRADAIRSNGHERR
jgi:RNA polymerase sigma factor (sigma-70 family)